MEQFSGKRSNHSRCYLRVQKAKELLEGFIAISSNQSIIVSLVAESLCLVIGCLMVTVKHHRNECCGYKTVVLKGMYFSQTGSVGMISNGTKHFD